MLIWVISGLVYFTSYRLLLLYTIRRPPSTSHDIINKNSDTILKHILLPFHCFTIYMAKCKWSIKNLTVRMRKTAWVVM